MNKSECPIDWSFSTSDVLLNPRFPSEKGERVRTMLLEDKTDEFAGHLWIATSGSTGDFSTNTKWVALSKKAILSSAEAVNIHLDSSSSDIWLNALPGFHVGGVGIWARAHSSGASVVNFEENLEGARAVAKWDVKQFHAQLFHARATLTALVPTQIYDLVKSGFSAPKNLRAVVVGGGSLNEALYRQAIGLGWNLLPSYGMTECASQVATAELFGREYEKLPSLKPLSHMQLAINEHGCLCIKSSALLTTYAFFTPQGISYIDPKVDGWFHSEDRAELVNGMVKVFGRQSDFIKIGGESVNIASLEKVLEECRLKTGVNADVALVAVPDERLGHVIHLAMTQTSEEIKDLIDLFHQRILPFEKVRNIHVLKQIPRSALNKPLRSQLLEMITIK